MSAQEISTCLRYRLNPIIFLVNNEGYTIEVVRACQWRLTECQRPAVAWGSCRPLRAAHMPLPACLPLPVRT
jgi:hypothetical protein